MVDFIKSNLSKIFVGIAIFLLTTGIGAVVADRIHISEAYATKKEVSEKCDSVEVSCKERVEAIRKQTAKEIESLKNHVDSNHKEVMRRLKDQGDQLNIVIQHLIKDRSREDSDDSN